MTKSIYLDHAAATPLDKDVLKAMMPYLAREFANPSSLYEIARNNKDVLTRARQTIADVLQCNAPEIVFTASGTEANNLALFGMARKRGKGHILVLAIEHESVIKPARQLEREGFRVTYLPVQKNGIVDVRDVECAITPDTILISVMMANNEIGTLQPVQKIGGIVKSINRNRALTNKLLLHTDACQAIGSVLTHVNKLGVDLLTLNGSKVYGPKGVGALYVRKGIQLEPVMYGGGQERGLRSGTENVAAIAGLAAAVKKANAKRDTESKRLAKLRDATMKRLEKMEGVRITGDRINHLPNNIHITVENIEGEEAVLYLDKYGIQASTGSACTTTSLEPSHVLTAIGMTASEAAGSLRFTMGRGTTKKDLDALLRVLPRVITQCRRSTLL
ncbi:MAG: cysteine desulfurase [Candidatus Kerfeldbacteria bacterium]|nr:cysteine desulfurase [Candidatus Kerfeldbacteria bacterium]